MGFIGVFVFVVNFLSVMFLMSYWNGDVNICLVWLCSCNDVIGNVVVIGVVMVVVVIGMVWFDFIVVVVMVVFFLMLVY